jgi:hypothetical protein
MASIAPSLFSWQAVEASSEIRRFQCVLDALNDEALIGSMEVARKGRRNDYPLRAMWNSLFAGMVFRHDSIESLRRELGRNGELRQACGFDPLRGEQAVPSKDAYSRLLLKLIERQEQVDEVFADLVGRVGRLLADFGRYLAADGKAIKAARKDDEEAGVGFKKQGHPDGEESVAVTYSWFGYKLHMLCDATHELPVAFEVTAGNEAESPRLIGLLEATRQRHGQLLERTEALSADKGYDDGADKAALYDEYGVLPVIPARDMKKGAFEPLDPKRHDTVYVSSTGQVCCKIDPFAGDPDKAFAPMYYMGFEKDRSTLKFRCPAAAWGIECKNREACACPLRVKNGSYGRVVRVALERDRRLFGPVYGHSYRFEDLYKMRTSVERLFFRVDHMYGFERHHTVGLKRVRLRVSLAMIAMQATAVGWIEAGQSERMRSLNLAA